MKEENNNMSFGFLEVLTLIFIVLKLTGFISWSWFWVLFPIIFDLGLAIILFIITIIILKKER